MYPLLEIALTLGVLFTLVLTISACVCGCKNSNQKSELVGTAGVLKIHYDEEAPSPTPTTPASIKRASTQNSQRSLPEIPHPVGRHDSGDTASDIYATVNIDEGNKIKAVASSSRDHPYEHAYAKVQNENDAALEGSLEREPNSEVQVEELEAGQFGPESVMISASVAISGHLPSSQELPYITPPSPRPHERGPQHFSGDSTDSTKGYTSISVREPLSNIRAALQANKTQVQAQYAAVSDDSDEMYAAIEEPVNNRCSAEINSETRTRLVIDTYAQIAPVHAHPSTNTHVRRSLEREPTPVRTTGADVTSRRSAPPEMGATNATHSRQASSSSCTNSGAHSSPKPEKRQANSPLPPTPANTRPAAERGRSPHAPATTTNASHRQQRISSTGDLHFSHDKVRRSLNEKHQRNNSCVSSSDFYGCNYPVDKHRFSSGDLCRPLGAKELRVATEPTDALYNSIDGPTDRAADSPTRNLDDMYAKVVKKAKIKVLPDDGHVTRRNKDFSRCDGESNASNYREDDPGYETIDRKKSTSHGYETIAHKDRKSSQSQDPGYETVKDIHRNTPNVNFANNNLMKLNTGMDSGPDSLLSSDPGYEHIAKTDNSASDSDPNYEVLRNQPPTPPYATIPPNFKAQPTYSIVNKKLAKCNDWTANNNDPTLEPNYESMPNDPLYTTGSESDPNYESVRPKDPNYESVSTHDPSYESLHRKDPKYESVRSKDSKYDSVRSKDPNYESVKYFELSKKDPPYERLHNKMSESNEIERSDSTAGYEKINVPNNRDPKNSLNSGENGTVSDYFQV